MTIKPGDRVKTPEEKEVLVLAVTATQAWCQYPGGYCCTRDLSDLTPIAPEPEPAEGLLTNAQLAQVFEALAKAFALVGLPMSCEAMAHAAKEARNG